MADDDGSPRQPPQAYDTVSPAGVGATTTNQASPVTMQQLYFTGDEGLLDVAMEEMPADALQTFLESLPSPNTVAGWPNVGGASPAGVGSQASHTPSTDGARTPHRGSPRLSSGARTPLSQGSARLLAAAGAGGGGDDDDGSRGSRRSTPRGRPDQGRGRGRGRGRRPRRPNPSPTLPFTRPVPSPQGSWSPGRAPRTLNQADLQRRLRMMLQDQEQLAQGRDISTVTMTNSIVTSYKQGGAPSVQTSSSRLTT